MAKKKLLSEAQVRRFMGLAGMQSKIVSNYLKEGDWGYNRDINEEEEEFPPEEEPAMDPTMDAPEDELPPEEAPLDDAPPEGDMPGEDVEVGETEIQAALDALGALEALVQPLADAAGLEAEAPEGGEEMGELPPEEPDMGGEELPPPEGGEELPAPEEEEEVPEDVLQEALAGVDIRLSKEEVINEVAKRVAQRILRAKKAQKAMNEALGSKAKK